MSAGSVDPRANSPRSVRVKPKRDPAHPGDVDVAVLEHGHRLGHGDLGEPLDLRVRDAGERDAGQVAHPAAAPRRSRRGIGRSPDPARPSRARPRSPWCRPGSARPPPVRGGSRRRARRRAPSSTRSSRGCGSGSSLHRGIGQGGEVHVHPAERQSESRDGSGAGCFESLQQASVAQQLQDLPAETAGLRDLPGSAAAARTPAAALRPGPVHTASISPVGPAPTMITSASTCISPPPVSVGSDIEPAILPHGSGLQQAPGRVVL